jgi:predicted ArsR family transcriptional regulator
MAICAAPSGHDSGETDLFRAAIRQAIQDALGQGLAEPPDQAAAYHLLTSPDLPWSEDRETLCSLAAVDEFRLVQWSREKLPPQPAPPPLDADAVTLLELFADQRMIPLKRLADEFDMDRKAVRAAVALCQRNGWTCWLSSKACHRWDVPETADARSALSMSPPRDLPQKMEDVLKILDRPMTAKMVGFAAGLGDNGVRETLHALVEAGCVTARTMPIRYRITDAGRGAVAVRGGWQSKVLAAMIDHGEPMSAEEIRGVGGHRSLKPLVKDKLVARVGSAGDAKAKWYSRTGKDVPLDVLAAVNRELDRIDGEDILAALRTHGPFTLAHLTEQLPISRGLVYRLLIELEHEGKVQREKPRPRVRATAAGRAALSVDSVRRSTQAYTALVALIDAGAGGIEVERITDGPIATLRRLGYAEAIDQQGTRRAEVWSLVETDQADAPAKLAA